MRAENYRINGTNTFRFPSLSAIGETASYDSTPKRLERMKAWTGETWEETLASCQHGDLSRVSEAQAMLSEIEKHVDLGAMFPAWESDVAGAFPSVPDFLAGVPECMRRKRFVAREYAPVKLYVCTSSSADIPHDALMRRGTAILALAMALQMTRPVELFTFTAMGGDRRGDSLLITALGSAPFVLSESAYALTSAGFHRNAAHAIGRKHCGFDGNFARCVSPLLRDSGSSAARDAMLALREKLGATAPGDLVIPPSLSNDWLINQPVQWVIERLKDYAAAQD